jgi:hypothetical protein
MMHQIYYRPEHLPKLYPFAKPYYNEGLTIFFENKPIADIVSTSESPTIAVASWKLGQKLRRSQPLTPERLNSNYQVLSFTRNSTRHNMMAMSNAWHPGFLKTITLLWEKLGLKIPGEVKDPIYQNHWSGKSEIYKRYVSEFLSPAMNISETDEELHSLMIQPSGYGKLSREADLKSVKEKLGMNDYPLAPFILERCPSLWMTLHRIPVTYL